MGKLDTKEDFFNDINQEDISKIELNKTSENNIEDININDDFSFIENEEERKNFSNLVKICREKIKDLPFQDGNDYIKTKEYINSREVEYKEFPSPKDLSWSIAKIQAIKDHFCLIKADADRNYNIRKKIYDLLFDAYVSISDQKSSDKRKGEASMRLYEFSIGCTEAEAFCSYCKHIFENLDSQHKTFSRQIACLDIAQKIGDISTGKEVMENLHDAKDESMSDSEKKPGFAGW